MFNIKLDNHLYSCELRVVLLFECERRCYQVGLGKRRDMPYVENINRAVKGRSNIKITTKGMVAVLIYFMVIPRGH